MKTRREVDNNQDILDSRDIIARIDELESELQDAHDDAESTLDFTEWVDEVTLDTLHALQDEATEYKVLKDLADECEGYGDWNHGETLIRDSYFENYARELASDIGAISKDDNWPYTCIDWEEAAKELQQDYLSVEFDGVEYWMRA